MNVTWNFLTYLGMYLKSKTSLKRHARLSTRDFCCLLVKAAFLLGLLNLSGGVLIVASQRLGGPRVAHPSPWVCMRGGITEASACVAAIVYKGTRGWATPMSAQRYNRKQGSGKILETRTHTCHSLDLGGSTLYYFGDTRRRRRKRAEVGELVSDNSWFLNVRKRRKHMNKFTGLRHETLHYTPTLPSHVYCRSAVFRSIFNFSQWNEMSNKQEIPSTKRMTPSC